MQLAEPVGNLFATCLQPVGNLFATCWQPVCNLLATCSQPVGNLFATCWQHHMAMHGAPLEIEAYRQDIPLCNTSHTRTYFQMTVDVDNEYITTFRIIDIDNSSTLRCNLLVNCDFCLTM
jgi:hypothetical protein